MKKMIQDCWDQFQLMKSCPFILKDSMPILWFGDLNSYFKSEKRIVTVGINPSDIEFKDNKGRLCSVNYRFPKVKKLLHKTKLSFKDIDDYIESLNYYFKNKDPYGKLTYYAKWFSSYENALNALDASYFTGEKNRTAIHIDLCTPVATSKKWGDLTNYERTCLMKNSGVDFNHLLNKLEAEVIIASLNKDYIKQFKDSKGSPCTKSNADSDIKINSVAFIRSFSLNNNRILIWARNSRTPLGYMSYCDAKKGISIIKTNYIKKGIII